MTKTELINLYEIVEGKPKNITKEKIEYSIDKNIDFNIINNYKTEKLRALPENKNENEIDKIEVNKNEVNENIQNENDKNEINKKLDNINFNIFPVKVEKFELINKINKIDSDERKMGIIILM